jgi:hypothetical protein
MIGWVCNGGEFSFDRRDPVVHKVCSYCECITDHSPTKIE